MAVGFGLFFGLRIPLASIPFTGTPFFPSDLSLSLPDVLLVALGVPLAAAIAARLALRRVRISPLGVTRRVTPKAPRAWRVIPLLAGVGALGFVVVHGRPPTTPEQIQAFLPAFLLIMVGPGHRRAVADHGRGPPHGAADQPAGHADRRAAGSPTTRRPGSARSAAWSSPCSSPPWPSRSSPRRTPRAAKPLDGPAAANVLADQFSDDPQPATVPAPPAALGWTGCVRSAASRGCSRSTRPAG